MAVVAPDSATRERVVDALKDARIQSSFHYPNVTGFEAFAGHRDAAVPHSAGFAGRVITLPMHPLLSDADVDQVCDVLLGVTARA
jgi:dTDP-4-amino-4,6-dideoxygalactose transaminase